MYVLLIWEILSRSDKKGFDEALQNILEAYSWHRPLTNFYIVKIKDTNEWTALFNALSAIAKGFPDKINFFMSQLLEGTGYNGWLPIDDWDEIMERMRE